MKQMNIFDFLDVIEGDISLEDLFKNYEDKESYISWMGTYEYFPDNKDCDCSEKINEAINNFENDIFNFSRDFYSNRRIYLGKDLNNIPLFISSLAKNEYSFIVEIDEFSNISIIPVHKEYDEASIEIIPWD